jgi:hypothetical protein
VALSGGISLKVFGRLSETCLTMVITTPRPDLPDGLVERLCAGPSLRHDRIAAAIEWLACGLHPCADDVAAAVVADTRAFQRDEA